MDGNKIIRIITALRHRTLITSSIKVTQPVRNTSDSIVYDLSGRPLYSMPLKPGIYIQGGKKVLIR